MTYGTKDIILFNHNLILFLFLVCFLSYNESVLPWQFVFPLWS